MEIAWNIGSCWCKSDIDNPENIGEVTDVFKPCVEDNRVMNIQLVLDEIDPPTGTVSSEGREDQPFIGWLGLLHAISELTALPVRL